MKPAISNRRSLLAVALTACLLLFSVPLVAMELVMVEQSICPYCKMFDREVGADYNTSEIGKKVPLRRVSLDSDWPEDLTAVSYDRLTPTFILVEDGKELGRLRGYPGRVIFWELLSQMLKKHENAEE